MAHKRKSAGKENKICNSRCSEMTSPQKKLHVHTDNTNATGPLKVDNNVKQSSNGAVQEKNPKVQKMFLRRSERLKSSVLPSENRGAESVVEHVDLVENEKEEEQEEEEEEEAPDNSEQVNTFENEIEEAPDNSQQVDTLPIAKERDSEKEAPCESALPEINGRSLEEKVDYLVTVADKLKSEVYRRRNEGSPRDLSYKALYIASRKEIEALVEKNYGLARDLDYAHGKIAAYESMKNSVIGSKEVYLLSPLGKASEVGASLSDQVVQNCSSPPAATIPGNANARKRHRKKK